MKKKVGLLGGSFDPIHFGHLHLAISLSEMCSLDKVLFCPTALSPFKVDRPSHVPIEHRYQMVRLAIQRLPSFEVLDWEAHGKGPFYTIDTVRKLLEQNPAIELHLLLADDHVERLNEWKEADELLRLAPPLVGGRQLEISSTEIRQRLSQKKYCGHLVPALVLDYISQHRLYS